MPFFSNKQNNIADDKEGRREKGEGGRRNGRVKAKENEQEEGEKREGWRMGKGTINQICKPNNMTKSDSNSHNTTKFTN